MSWIPLRPWPAALAVLLVGAIVLNLAQFRAVDASAPPNFAAVERGHTSDLAQIAYHECQWCQDRYSLHIALRVVAPGSRVIVDSSVAGDLPAFADDHHAAEELVVRLLTFGGADQVGWLDAETADVLLDRVDPEPFVIATGPGGRMGPPWALAVDPARPPVDFALPDGELSPLAGDGEPDLAEFLAAALAAGAHRGTGPPPGEFVLLRWRLARPGSEYSYQDLLLETSLLPAPARSRLLDQVREAP